MKHMTRHHSLVAALAVLGVIGGAAGTAQATNLGDIGASCVPDSASMKAGTVHTAGHGIKFKPGTSGTIRLICPINHVETGGSIANWDGMQLWYVDPDGPGLDYRIQAKFKHAPIGSTVSATYCTADSNAHAATVHGMECQSGTLDPSDGHWYWVEIIITRAADATSVVEFLGWDIY